MSATVSIFYDKRNAPSGELYIKWSIIYQRQNKMYSTGLIVSVEDGEFLRANKNGLTGHTQDQRKIKLWNIIYGLTFKDDDGKIQVGYLKRAKDVIKKLGDNFTFVDFEAGIRNLKTISPAPPVSEKKEPAARKKKEKLGKQYFDLLLGLTSNSDQMKVDEQYGTAGLYKDAAQSLKRFLVHLKLKDKSIFLDELPYENLTPDFLKAYERWMLKNGKAPKKEGNPEKPASLATIGFYLRNIRAVYNLAKAKRSDLEEFYPFGVGKYIIPKGDNTKKALTKEQIDMIMDFKCRSDIEAKSRDLWVFSYLSNGANFNDILRLQWKDVDLAGGSFTFFRRKTMRTKKHNIKKIRASIFQPTFDIIKTHGSKYNTPETYVFPYLTEKMTELEKEKKIDLVIGLTNTHMKAIAVALEIKADVNTYSCRHSFGTIMLRSNAPLALISELFGHSAITTTQNYFAGFEEDTTKGYLQALLPAPKIIDTQESE